MGSAGEAGTSSRVGRMLSPAFNPFESVLRLSWLGLRFMAGMAGFMNEGEEGSETRFDDSAVWNGGWIDRPFMLRALLGDGDVIGRGRSLTRSVTVRVFMLDDRPDDKPESPPNVVAGKELRGIKLTGESGEDDGDGSERDDVSVVSVVVGEESADSEFCAEVLSC